MGQNRSGHLVLRIISMAAALLVVDARFSMANCAELTEFKVGLSEPVNTALALWMAEAGGFYAARGLKVEIINMNGGSRGAQELQAGRLDAMHVGLSSVVRINRSGGDLRVVAALSNVIRFTFFSAPGVNTPADLKGGVVGVSSFGSESDATVTLALKRLGLARDDVVVKEYGGGSRRLEALKSGEIKATSVNEPVSSLAREQGLNAMVDLVPEQIPWLFTAVVVKRSALESRRETLIQFVKAVAEGNYLALADEKRAKEVLAKEAKITDPKILDISYNDFKKQAPLNTEPTRVGAENILAQFPATGSTNIADYVDISILDQLKREGFFAELQKKYPTAR
jgi:NitT/TauT family transport system substrate-binding protein